MQGLRVQAAGFPEVNQVERRPLENAGGVGAAEPGQLFGEGVVSKVLARRNAVLNQDQFDLYEERLVEKLVRN